jgi:Vacuolar protein sorting-associated protein 62
MTDAHVLLARHSPRLVYDSQEAYFADSAAIWTDSATNVLKRANGTLLAKPPQLALGYLGAHGYVDDKPVLADDVIGETTKDYTRHAAAQHAKPAYRNRLHGRPRRDASGRLWLQYWFFYYYNDFQLAGPLLSGGKHEGDWEMIQIRLDTGEQPVEAVFSQHKGAERQDWSFVAKAQGAPATPLVYVARGSHACYFRAGTQWTGVWWDHADGKGPTIAPALVDLDPAPAWALWPGFWGDTKATPSPLDSSSPRGPVGHAQWSNPAVLVDTARRTAAARAAAPRSAVPPAPAVSARRAGTGLVISYDTAGTPPAALVVSTRPEGSQAPATTYPIEITAARGEFELPDAAPGDRPLEVSVSTAEPGGVSSPAGTTRVDP